MDRVGEGDDRKTGKGVVRPDLTEAKDHADDIAKQAEAAAHSLRELCGTYTLQGRPDDVIRLVEALNGVIGPDLDETDRIRLLLTRARAMEKASRRTTRGLDGLIELLKDLVARATKIGVPALRAEALYLLAAATMGRSELVSDASYDDALEFIEESLKLRREEGDTRGTAESLFRLGIVYQHRDGDAETDADKALQLLREACELAEKAGDEETQAHALCHIGWIQLRAKGDPDEALEPFEASLRIAREIGWLWFIPPALEAVGVAHLERGEFDRAQPYFEETERLAEESGSDRYRFSSPIRIGDLLKAKGEIDAARREYERAIGIAESFGFASGTEAARARIESL